MSVGAEVEEAKPSRRGPLRLAKDILKKKPTQLPRRIVQVRPENVSGGQAINSLQNYYRPLAYNLPWELLEYLELLSRFNPDFAQAVDNNRTLANSGHEVEVTSSNQRAGEGLKQYIENRAGSIQDRMGGVDGIINSLLDMGSVFGCMTGEWILNEAMTEVIDFAFIHPKNVRFSWDDEQQQWQGWQKVPWTIAQQIEADGYKVRKGSKSDAVLGSGGRADLGATWGYVPLNPITFFYYPFDPAPGSPYGTPPFLASLLNIQIQTEMQQNMVQLTKKLGLLGIVDLKLAKLEPEPDEEWAAYEARLTNYLSTFAEMLEEMAKDGGIVHFDDSELQVTSAAGNAAGATNIFKQNEEQVFSGLKSMPSVQGRSYSTTETYAGVSYDIIIRNSKKFQRGVKRLVEGGYYLMALVADKYVDGATISLQFKENRSLTRLQDAKAHQQEIDNQVRLWAEGLKNQQDAGMALGIAKPREKKDEPETGLWFKKPDPPVGGVSGGAAEPSDNGRPTGSSGGGGSGNAGNSGGKTYLFESPSGETLVISEDELVDYVVEE